MSKEKRSVPKLRFPGFTEDWEQCKLGSIGSTYTGLSGKTKEDFGHGEAQYITYLNVFQNTISDTTMTDKVEIDTTQNEVKYGDVLFTTSSETPEEVGMSSVWLSDTPNIYLNSFCFGFRPNQKIDPYFLGYSLRAPYMRDKIKILAQGISRYNISKNKVMELEISMPNNEEQKLLGTFLQHIDLIITLHQRKLEHLNLKKKALLQKLFPKNGERYPELRFPGFTDAWEQRKLESLGKIITGNTPSTLKKEYWSTNSEGVVWITPTDINSVKTDWSERLLTEEGASQARIVPANSILVTCIASIGKNTINTVEAAFNQQINALVPHLSNSYFILTMLNNMESAFKRVAGTSATSIINKKEFGQLSALLPRVEEQNKIGEIFELIDKSITLHQQEPFLCGNSVNGGVELC